MSFDAIATAEEVATAGIMTTNVVLPLVDEVVVVVAETNELSSVVIALEWDAELVVSDSDEVTV